MAGFTIDTSAVSCYLRQEPGFERIEEIFAAARESGDRVWMPFIVPMEVEYASLRYESRDVVDIWLDELEQWPVEIVESDRGWRRMAAYVKSQFRLSLADAWVASLALLEDADLIHKDPEFDVVSGLKHLRLPYERNRRP